MTRDHETGAIVILLALGVGFTAAVRVLPSPWDLVYFGVLQLAVIASLIMVFRSWTRRK